MAEKYISVKAVKKKLYYIFRTYGTSEYIKKAILGIFDKVPTIDIVPVVHCKDCRYYSGEYCRLNDEDEAGSYRESKDFCSYGELKVSKEER